MIKLLEDNIGKYVHNIGVGQDVLRPRKDRPLVSWTSLFTLNLQLCIFTVNVNFQFMLKLGTLFIKKQHYKNEKTNFNMREKIYKHISDKPFHPE